MYRRRIRTPSAVVVLFALFVACSTEDGGPSSPSDVSMVNQDSTGDIQFPGDLTTSDATDSGRIDQTDQTDLEPDPDVRQSDPEPDEVEDEVEVREDLSEDAVVPTGPEIEITAPRERDEVFGEVSIEVAASDDIGVEGVTLEIDGDEVATLDEAPYQWLWDTSDLDPGRYVIEATAFDGDENSASDTVAVRVACFGDRDCPPSVRVVSPAPDSSICGTYVISARADDDFGVLRVAFEVDDDVVGSKSEQPYEVEWDSTTVEDGEHTVRVTAFDGEEQATSEEVMVVVDNGGGDCNNPPSIAIIEPSDRSYIHGDVGIDVAVTDDIGVSSVQYFVDRGSLGEDETVPFTATWRTDDFDEGVHTLAAMATDTGGETARDEVSVIVDRTPPELRIISPEAGDAFTGSVQATAEASDNIELLTVAFAIDRGPYTTLEEGPWEVVYPELSGGAHRLSVVATDAAGWTTSRAVVFSIDRPPTVVFVEPEEGDVVEGPSLVEVEATDDIAAPAVDLYDNGEYYGRFTGSTIRWNPAYERAAHTLRVVATDGRGQTADDEITVLVDYPFSITVSRCEGETCRPIDTPQRVSGTVRFRVTGNDDGGELDTVKTQVDDEPITTLNEAPFDLEWDTTAVDDGEYALSFVGINSFTDEDEVTIDAFVNNCTCNHDPDACNVAEVDSDAACECDPDCEDAEPCIADSVCDGNCPAGDDPDCSCEDIPTETEAGQWCLLPGTSCFSGRCLTSFDLPFGMCHQLCSPGSCEEICGEGVECRQEYTEAGELERFDDGRLVGTCGFSLISGAAAYDECDSVEDCRSGDLCIAVRESGKNQCFPTCSEGTICPSREGTAGACGYRWEETNLCGLPCSLDDPFSYCPTGMSCYNLDGVGLCHW